MEVRFTSQEEARLTQMASEAGTDAEFLVKQAALELLATMAVSRSGASGSLVTEMRSLRARIKPDPDGWTTRDYVNHGRR